jgi:hypothetical protein
MSAQSNLTPEQFKAMQEAKRQRLLGAFTTSYKPPDLKYTARLRAEKVASKQKKNAENGKKTSQTFSVGYKRGYDGLGDPEQFCIGYAASTNTTGKEEGRYALKYGPIGSGAQSMPAFFQSAPFHIVWSNFVGGGPEVYGKDSVLKRKWTMMVAYCMLEYDPETESYTGNLDPWPIVSRYKQKKWKANDPMNRKEKLERTLKHEYTLFHRAYMNAKRQHIKWVAEDPEGIIFGPNGGKRAADIRSKAGSIADEWAQGVRNDMKMQQAQNNGESDIPDYEISEWRDQEIYQQILARAKEPAVEYYMSFPDEKKMNEEQFKSMYINACMEDIINNHHPTIRGEMLEKMTKEEVLAAAIKEADEYIAQHPGCNEHVFTLTFDCPVWKAPAELNKKPEEKKKLIENAQAAYADIIAKIKAEQPNIEDRALKKLADINFVPIATTKPYDFKYNMPKIMDRTRKGEVRDLTFTVGSNDVYEKMHFAFLPNTMATFHFMLDFSLPVATSFDYGLKLKMVGVMEFMFPAVYLRKMSNNMDHFLNFGQSPEEYQTFMAVNMATDKEDKSKTTTLGDDGEDPNLYTRNTTGFNGQFGMTNDKNILINPQEYIIDDFMTENGISTEKQSIAKTKVAPTPNEGNDDEESALFDSPAASSYSTSSVRKRGKRAF